MTAVNTFGTNGLISRAAISGGTPTPTYYTFDTTGSVAQRTDATGAVTSSDLYDGFGAGLDPPPDPFGFGAQFGYYTDAETSLILCGHRYYDPTTARWLTRDPIGYAGGMDLYAYCGDRPVDTADPRGTDPIWPPSPQAARVAFSLFTGTMAVIQQVNGITGARPFSNQTPSSKPTVFQRVPSDPVEAETDTGEIVTEGEPVTGTIESTTTAEVAAPDAAAAVGEASLEATAIAGIAAVGATAWSGYEIYKYRPGHPSGPLTGAGGFWSETSAGRSLINGESFVLTKIGLE